MRSSCGHSPPPHPAGVGASPWVCPVPNSSVQTRDKAGRGPSGHTRWGDRSRGCAGLSVAFGSRHFQTFHHPTYGSCYTFNGDWAAQRPGITHGECQPGAGCGQRAPASLASPPAPRPPAGISLVLRAEQQDHLPLLSTEAGIKVMVHQRNHTPFLEHRGFSVRPGTETTIGIREVRWPLGGDRGGAPNRPPSLALGPEGHGGSRAKLKQPPPPRTKCTGSGVPTAAAPTARRAWTCRCCTMPRTPCRQVWGGGGPWGEDPGEARLGGGSEEVRG